MADLSLPALREAVAKMTEGPWVLIPEDFYCATTGFGPEGNCLGSTETGYPDDAAGIVALRNAAPALLDEVEALRQREAARDKYEEGLVIHAEQVEADLAAARAVLDSATLTGDTSYDHPPDPRVVVTLDRAAWLAWQKVKGV